MTLHGTFELGTYYMDNGTSKFRPNFSWNITSYEMITGCHDDDRNPTTQSKVDYIEVTLVSKDMLSSIVDWYMKDTMLLGRISVELQALQSSAPGNRIIEFADARCFSYVEDFKKDTYLRTITIRIAPTRVTVDGVEF